MISSNGLTGLGSMIGVFPVLVKKTAKAGATPRSLPLRKFGTFRAYHGLALTCQDWLHVFMSSGDIPFKISIAPATVPCTRGITESYYYQAECLRRLTCTKEPRNLDSASIWRSMRAAGALCTTYMTYMHGLRERKVSSLGNMLDAAVRV